MCRPPANQPSVCTSSSESGGGLQNTDGQQGSGSESQNTDGQQQSGPGRKKRSPGGEEETVTKVDNEGNARFVKLMMSIDEETRIDLGHSFGPQFSVIENATRTGFIYSCAYKGLDCNNERCLYLFLQNKIYNSYFFKAIGTNSTTQNTEIVFLLIQEYLERRYSFIFKDCFNLLSYQVRQVTVTGSNHGLVLELFLDQTNYMYNKLSRMAGARIDVHDPQYEKN